MSDPSQEVYADKAVAALTVIREACQQHGLSLDHVDNLVKLYCAERIAMASEQISYAMPRS